MTQKKPFSFYRRKSLRHVNEARRKNAVTRKITAAQIAADKRATRIAALYAAVAPEREIPSGRTWFVFISARNREHVLAEALQTTHSAFCVIPLIKTAPRSKSAGRAKTKPRLAYDRPALPRLVFAGFERPPNFHAIGELPECTDWLLVEGRPATVTGRGVARFLAETEKHRHMAARKAEAKPGAKVRMAEPHAMTDDGEIMEILRMNGRYAVLSKMMLGKAIEVDVAKLEIVRAA